LYALFSETDEFHERAIDAVRESGPIIIPHEIFSETIALVQYRQGFRVALRVGDWLLHQGRFSIPLREGPELVDSWRIFRSARGALNYPDCVVVAWCHKLNAEPLSFDEAILRRV
jgi:predicted nucleic acid-binding protein